MGYYPKLKNSLRERLFLSGNFNYMKAIAKLLDEHPDTQKAHDL